MKTISSLSRTAVPIWNTENVQFSAHLYATWQHCKVTECPLYDL